jgi:hypothetical protein
MRYFNVILLCFAVGCGATNPSHGGGGNGGTGGGGSGGSGGGGGTGGTGGGGGTGGTGGSGGGSGSDCSDAAKLIYVIDSDGTFSSFKPDQTDITKSVFTDIGKLSCTVGGIGGFGATPFSMSVDRSATAWVEYQTAGGDSALFKVSTANAACTNTTYKSGQAGFKLFGMGFVSDAAMSQSETLYIAGGGAVGSPANLGKLDLSSLTITKGGSITGDPELTGTGLAQLWGFYPVTTGNAMPRVSMIDKSSAAESNTIQLSSLTGQAEAWAFAFYGGDFWVFLASQGNPTIVYRVTQGGGMQPVGQLDTKTRHIVGAGVSTCAPTTPIG